MKKLRQLVGRFWPRRREDGVAILMTLGILSLVLVLALSFAATSLVERQAAGNYINQITARMLAESGVQRSIGFLQRELGQEPIQSAKFYASNATDWADKRLLASISTSDTATVDDALNVKLNSIDFTPATNNADTTLNDNIGWLLVESREDGPTGTGGAGLRTKYIGRFCYLILDETGKADPSVIVGSAARAGSSMNELDLNNLLGDAGLSSAFQSDMPDSTSWFGWPHVYNGISSVTINATRADSIANHLFPFSEPVALENYWDDRDGDGLIDTSDSEIIARLDIAEIYDGTSGSLTAAALYDAFTGADYGNRDDSRKFCPWLREVGRNPNFKTESKLRQVAAQVAVNLVDHVDSNDDPTELYVANFSPYAASTTAPAGTEWRVQGAEGEYFVGEVMMAVEVERSDSSTGVITPIGRVEIVNPLATSGFNGSVKVFYTYRVDGDSGPESGTASITFNHADGSNSNYGSAKLHYWPATADSDQVITSAGFFDNTASPDSYSQTTLQITKVQINRTGSLIDYMPGDGGAFVDQYPTTGITIYTGEKGYGWLRVEARDPFLNDFSSLGNGSTLFGSYMSSSNGVADDSVIDHPFWNSGSPTDAGGVVQTSFGSPRSSDSTWYNNAISYGGATVDVAIASIYDLGRVKGWWPGRSLRLFTADIADSVAHDGYLLDMFKASSQPKLAGTINLNTYSPAVLKMLFSGVTATANVDAVVSRVQALSGADGAGGGPITGVGALCGVPNMLQNAATADATAEGTNLKKITNLASIEQNFYTIIVAAQALRDIGGASAVSGAIRLVDGAGSSDTYGLALSEQKVMATVFRDVFTNTFKVLSYEYLDE